MAKKVKYHKSTFTGIPQISGQVGTLNDLFTAVLKDGYNPQTPTAVSKSGDYVTVTFSADHGYTAEQTIRLGGASPVNFNGDWEVYDVPSTTTLRFNGSSFPETGPASGAFTCKAAPADWDIIYSSGNKKVYKPLASDATGCVLIVNDNQAKYASVQIAEGWSNDLPVNAGSVKRYHKSIYADSTAIQFTMFASHRGGAYLPIYYPSYIGAGLHLFGDFYGFRSGDAWDCLLSGFDSTDSPDPLTSIYANNNSYSVAKFIRRYSQTIPGEVNAYFAACVHNSYNSLFLTATNGSSGVSEITNGCSFDPVFVCEYINSKILRRGLSPGMMVCDCLQPYPDGTTLPSFANGYPYRIKVIWVANGCLGFCLDDAGWDYGV